MNNDPLYSNISDPTERKRALVDNAAIVVQQLKEKSGHASDLDTVNQLSYLGQVIKTLGSL